MRRATRLGPTRAASAAHGPRRLISLLAIPSRYSTLNRNQWIALVLIAFGCIAKEAPKFYADTGSANPARLEHGKAARAAAAAAARRRCRLSRV